MQNNAEIIGIAIAIVLLAFGGLFWSLRIILNNGVRDMKETLTVVVEQMDKNCKLVSGNLHCNVVSETKQRVYADEKLEGNFKTHGHKGLDNGGSKVTI